MQRFAFRGRRVAAPRFPLPGPGRPGPRALVGKVVGGAGASTVARLLGPATQEIGLAGLRPASGDEPLLLVTRDTAAGTHALLPVLEQAARLGYHRPAVVLVADGPWAPPAQARARARMLNDPARIRLLQRLPYVPGWRDLDDPLAHLTEVPRALRAPLRLIEHALHTAAGPPA